jgi:hypothetical protein
LSGPSRIGLVLVDFSDDISVGEDPWPIRNRFWTRRAALPIPILATHPGSPETLPASIAKRLPRGLVTPFTDDGR